MDVRYLIQSNELISVFSLDFLSLGFFSLGVFSLNLQSFMLDVSNSGFTPSDIIGYMKSFLFTKNEQFFAYYYSPTLSHLDSTHLGSSKNLLLQDRRVEQVPFDGWDIYSHVREFERQGLYEKCAHNTLKWRVSTMNEHYQICDSYPCLLGVSAVMGGCWLFVWVFLLVFAACLCAFSDPGTPTLVVVVARYFWSWCSQVPMGMHNGEELTRAADYRSKNRMIALSWRKGALFHLEQGATHRVGLTEQEGDVGLLRCR